MIVHIYLVKISEARAVALPPFLPNSFIIALISFAKTIKQIIDNDVWYLAKQG